MRIARAVAHALQRVATHVATQENTLATWCFTRGCVQVVSQCGPHAQWRTHSAACEETKTARDGAHRFALPADAAQLCRMRVRAVNPNGAGAYSEELCVRIPALL